MNARTVNVTLRSTLLAALIGIASLALAVNDPGGGGGGVYIKRTAGELMQVLQGYYLQRDALRLAAALALTAPSAPAPLTVEEEMQYLHEEAFRAQVAQRQAAAQEYQSWLAYQAQRDAPRLAVPVARTEEELKQLYDEWPGEAFRAQVAQRQALATIAR